jgi:dTDP-4-dehydrorhamnose reductase
MNQPKFLVLGSGMLGEEYEAHGHTVLQSKDFRIQSDFTENDVYRALHSSLGEAKINLNDYDAIVNCIGISDTRYCEDPKNWKEISIVNGLLPGYLSDYCEESRIKFIHISTGCLYDQPHRPCMEDESLAAHCNYVVSKWQGELGCDKERDIIIRPRLLFGEREPQKGKRNNLICKLQKFNKFVDAFDSITWIGDIVSASDALIRREQSGVFNVACKEVKTMYQYATEHLGLEGSKVTPEELRKSQKLHLVNNVMDVSKIEEFVSMTPLNTALEHCLEKLGYKT